MEEQHARAARQPAHSSIDPIFPPLCHPLLTSARQQLSLRNHPQILDEMAKLRQILRGAAGNRAAGGCGSAEKKSFLGYTDILMSLRCLAMGAFWTFDNLNYLTTTDTVGFGVERATRGLSRSWSVSSALYILLGIDSLRKVC